MKKKLLFLVAALALFVPSVMAAEVSTTEELKTCLAKDGNTCKLTKSLTDVPTLVLTDGTIVLDLNGNNITFAESSRLNVKKGNLTITGEGKISESVPSTAPVTIYGSVDEKDTKYTTVTIEKNVILEGLYGSFISISNDSKGKSHAYGTTVNINGTLIGLKEGNYNGAGFYINGSLQDTTNAPVINVNSSAKLEGKGGAIYGAGYAVWNINGAKLTGDSYGVGLKAGKFVLNNVSLETVGAKKDGTYNGNGINEAGAAIQIESNNGYAGEIEITINGGSYKSENGDVVYHYSAAKPGSTEAVKNSLLKLNIEKGTFTGGFTFLDDDKVLVTGGTFSTDVTKFVGDKYVVNKTGNTYTVVENKVLETNDEKVIFESEEAIRNDLSLKVTEKTEDEIKKGTEKVTEAYKDNKKVKEVKLINLYEIDVLNGDGGVEELEDGKFTIAIAIPESDQKYDNYKVVYFDEEGKLVETLNAKLENGKVVFTTSHLSTYGVVGYNNVTETPTETKPEKNPTTSDINLALIISAIVISTIGVVITSKKISAKVTR